MMMIVEVMMMMMIDNDNDDIADIKFRKVGPLFGKNWFIFFRWHYLALLTKFYCQIISNNYSYQL